MIGFSVTHHLNANLLPNVQVTIDDY